MKKVTQLIFSVAMVLALATTSFAQIVIDGDATDWNFYPLLSKAQDNIEGSFPEGVLANFSDRVDIKKLKATYDSKTDRLNYYISFQGGPVWPNLVKNFADDGKIESRGYYGLYLDLDNDVSTGMKTDEFEDMITTVAYYISTGAYASDAILGAETLIDLGLRTHSRTDGTTPPPSDFNIWSPDHSGLDTNLVGLGDDLLYFNLMVKDTNSAFITDSLDQANSAGYVDGVVFDVDGNEIPSTQYWAHAFGTDFLEISAPMAPYRDYFKSVYGVDFIQDGDQIALCAQVGTPIDGWGLDMGPKGVIDIEGTPPAFAMDGDASDWSAYPVLSSAQDNIEGSFPDGVLANFSDRVDIKDLKAHYDSEADRLYYMISFQGGPVWPNLVKNFADDGKIESRGYYGLYLDLDNDVSTGMNTEGFEDMITTVAYYISTGVYASDAILGAETLIDLGVRTHSRTDGTTPPSSDFNFWSPDHSGLDTNIVAAGDDLLYVDFMATYTDSIDLTIHGDYGVTHVLDADGNEKLSAQYWAHAFGSDFLEVSVPMAPYRDYFSSVYGVTFIQDGDEIALCAQVGTPIDGWGLDMGPKGVIAINGDTPPNPPTLMFAIDGDASDWEAYPVLSSALDNIEGSFPEGVLANFTDRVDIKDLKAHFDADNERLYYMISFQGGPVWPNLVKNFADDGKIESRGYYGLYLDLDNDVSTGMSTAGFEDMITTVAHYISQGAYASDAILGAETLIDLGARTHSRTDGTTPPPSNLDFWSPDHSGLDTNIVGLGDDLLYFDLMTAFTDSAAQSTSAGFVDGVVFDVDGNEIPSTQYWAHAFGPDFLEVSAPMSPYKEYFSSVYGVDFFQNGDQIALCAQVGTPIDGWGLDMGPKGVIDVITGIESNSNQIVAQFELSNNYPNPFNPSTKIQYSLAANELVSLKVYDIIGREVATLVNKQQSAGDYNVNFDASNLSSGIYFYQIEAGNFVDVKKMILLK